MMSSPGTPTVMRRASVVALGWRATLARALSDDLDSRGSVPAPAAQPMAEGSDGQ
jgi:hypothetical protein